MSVEGIVIALLLGVATLIVYLVLRTKAKVVLLSAYETTQLSCDADPRAYWEVQDNHNASLYYGYTALLSDIAYWRARHPQDFSVHNRLEDLYSSIVTMQNTYHETRSTMLKVYDALYQHLKSQVFVSPILLYKLLKRHYTEGYV